MLLTPDADGRARIQEGLVGIFTGKPREEWADAVLSLVNTELVPLENAVLHALDRAAESPTYVNAVKRYEDWTGGEPSIGTIRNLTRISDGGYFCRDLAITLRGPYGLKR